MPNYKEPLVNTGGFLYEKSHEAINYMTLIDYRRRHEELADANIVYALSLKTVRKRVDVSEMYLCVIM